MEGNFTAAFGGKDVGKVQVKKEGLYYRFYCRCQLSGDVVCRLMVSCGGKQESLGVLIPMGDCFGLETKLAAKRLGEGEPEFRVVPNKVVMPGKFIPLKPEEPFTYIERLKDAYLARQEGQIGVIIKENPEQ